MSNAELSIPAVFRHFSVSSFLWFDTFSEAAQLCEAVADRAAALAAAADGEPAAASGGRGLAFDETASSTWREGKIEQTNGSMYELARSVDFRATVCKLVLVGADRFECVLFYIPKPSQDFMNNTIPSFCSSSCNFTTA